MLLKEKVFLIKNCNLFDGNSIFNTDILIKNKKIEKIQKNIEILSSYEVINAKKKLVTPGFIDLHTHLREPGYSYKETIKTGSMAAINGGFTCICTMPNLNPAPDNYENLKKQLEIIENTSVCKILPFMTMTLERKGKQISEFAKVFKDNPKICAGITDDGASVEDDVLMEEIFKTASEYDVLIASHCEYTKIYPKKESEYKFLERDIKLVEKYKCRYHAQHLSCEESVNLIANAKNKGLSVSAEVTPHHLFFCEEDILEKDGGLFKMNPPLRTKKDRLELKNAVKNGVIDIIATDHAPHAEFEKKIGFEKSLNGISGLETSFDITYNCLKDTMSLEKIISLFTENPKFIIKKNMEKNIGLKLGDYACLTIIELDKEKVIDSSSFFSLSKITPFNNIKVFSKISEVFLNGRLLLKNGKNICL